MIWVSINSNNETTKHSKIVVYLAQENITYQGVRFIYKNYVPITFFQFSYIMLPELGCKIGS